MAKKHKHEDHLNHEAWAIPYGDLITLLLAFFVVMYSMSSVNEGKYRVLADSLNEAFGGSPRSSQPIQVGPHKGAQGAASDPRPRILPGAPPHPGLRGSLISLQKDGDQGPTARRAEIDEARLESVAIREHRQLEKMADKVHEAMGDLIAQKLVVVRRYDQWLEVEIQTDLLYASGSAQLGSAAGAVLDRLAEVLREFDNHLRIEGHTDNVPIATREFPSNWELSSARAASVVHRFMAQGVAPQRMAVLGLSEYSPVVENTDAASRNRNRRVVIIILANPATQKLPNLPALAATPESQPATTEPASGLPQPLAAAGAGTSAGRAEP